MWSLILLLPVAAGVLNGRYAASAVLLAASAVLIAGGLWARRADADADDSGAPLGGKPRKRAMPWASFLAGAVGGALATPLMERTGTIGGIARASVVATAVGIAAALVQRWAWRRAGIPQPRPSARASRWGCVLLGAFALAWVLLLASAQLVSGHERLDRADLVFAGLVEAALLAALAREWYGGRAGRD